MTEEQMPRRGKGKRNVFCHYYSACLNLAIDKTWNHWHCDQCPLRTETRGAPEMRLHINYSVAYYEVLG